MRSGRRPSRDLVVEGWMRTPPRWTMPSGRLHGSSEGGGCGARRVGLGAPSYRCCRIQIPVLSTRVFRAGAREG